MIKQALYKLVAKRSGIDPLTTTYVCDALLETLSDALANGEPVYVGPLGKFGVKLCAEKTGRDILRGKSVKIPPHRVVRFQPSAELAKRVKEVNPETSEL